MLRKRLLLICFVLVAVVLITVKVGTSQILVDPIREQIESGLNWEIDQQVNSISMLIENRKNALEQLSQDLRIEQFLQNMAAGYRAGGSDENNAALVDSLNALAKSYNLANLQMVALKGDVMLEWDVEYGVCRSAKNYLSQKWMAYMLDHPEGVHLIETGDRNSNACLRLSACVTLSPDNLECLGFVQADVDLQDIAALFTNKDTNLFLLDYDNKLISPFYDHYLVRDACENLENGTTVLLDDKYLVTIRSLGVKGWRIAAAASLSELYTMKQVQASYFWLIAAIAVGFAVVVYLYAAHYISEPILDLTNHMLHMGEGELETIDCPKNYDGEIKILYDSYNEMTERINSLIEETYYAKVEEQEAELRALQAQINPHFIYNTLDTINWMAEKYEARDIQSMVLSLATMLRCSLNNGENLISVKGELEQVQSYLNIQQTRSPELFDVQYEIDDRILPYQIIKLVLQPLVENAVRHGFEGIPYKGLLIIRGRLWMNQIVLEVINNGNKPDMESIRRSLEMSPEEKPRSYGIRNVNEKLKKTYGDQYALSYESYADETIVSIRIPIADEDYNDKANQLLEKYRNIIQDQNQSRG